MYKRSPFWSSISFLDLPFSWDLIVLSPFSMPASYGNSDFLLPPTSKTWGVFIDKLFKFYCNFRIEILAFVFYASCPPWRKLDPPAPNIDSKYSEKSLSEKLDLRSLAIYPLALSTSFLAFAGASNILPPWELQESFIFISNTWHGFSGLLRTSLASLISLKLCAQTSLSSGLTQGDIFRASFRYAFFDFFQGWLFSPAPEIC